MVALRFLGRHRVGGVVSVTAWTDTATHHGGDSVGGRGGADLLGEGDGRPVDLVEPRRRVTELARPVGAGAPRRCLHHEARVMLAGDVQVAVVVPAQPLRTARVVEQRERREARQVEAVVENQLGLQSAVGHENPVADRLRQRLSMSRHDFRAM